MKQTSSSMESNESEAATKASNLDEGAQDKILDTGNNTNYKLAMLSQMYIYYIIN